jgi:hypothetical protein
MSLPTRWRAALIAVALPLLYLPLRAAETTPEPAAAAEPAEPAEGLPAPEPEEQEAAPAPRAPAEPQEQVSADNNLSFPVDI